MEPTEPCPACRKQLTEGCDCRSILGQWLNLLSVVERRLVSTLEVGSSAAPGAQASGSIDKLGAKLKVGLPIGDFHERLRISGLPSKPVRLRDGRWYMGVGDRAWGWFFRLNTHPDALISAFFTRPGGFTDFPSYMATLSRVLRPGEISALAINRLDLAVDYPMPLEKILEGLDVPYKRLSTQFMEEGGSTTGLMIGRGSEKIVVYDKAKREKVPGPLTRIEMQLTSARLPHQSITALMESLTANGSKSQSFGGVLLQDVEMIAPEAVPGSAARERYQELKVLLKRQGFLATRKKLNEHGNFERDYLPLLIRTPWREQPHSIIRRSLETFFRETATGQPPVHKLESSPSN